MRLTVKEQRVFDILKAGLKLNGPICRGVDVEKIYCLLYTRPKCSECDSNAEFLGATRGFSPTCSNSKCKTTHMRKINKNNFKRANEVKSQNAKAKREKYTPDIVNLYTAQNKTIVEIANHLNLPRAFVQSVVSHEKLTRKHNKWKQSFLTRNAIRLKPAIDKINDSNYRKRCLDLNLTSKEIAKELKVCSANWVAVQFRDHGQPLPSSKSQSSLERKLCNALNDYVIEQNDRQIIAPMELDLVLREHNLAIEVNGNYYHSLKDKYYHLHKTELCESRGIRLIHFSDDNILKNLQICKGVIDAHCGKTERVFARNTQIQRIDTTEYRTFLDTNHLQGFCGASIKYGLYHKGELMSVMSFGKPRFNKSYDFELIRFCNKVGFSVVGGASKLFAMFKREYPNSSCISYCARNLFTGDFHLKLGFELHHTTPPGYEWIGDHDRISRYKAQKHPTEMTEAEYWSSLGYYRVYDCGQRVFVYK